MFSLNFLEAVYPKAWHEWKELLQKLTELNSQKPY